MTRFFTSIALAGAASLYLMSAPVLAQMLPMKATLSGAEQVPPVDSPGKGNSEVTVDTEAKTITWTASHEGLTGPPTAAHFHGPAAPGEVAPPIIDITANIASGTAPLTDAQLADLQAGKVYLNIHTEKFPDGEIRGQVMK